jgi:hypothetical protein
MYSVGTSTALRNVLDKCFQRKADQRPYVELMLKLLLVIDRNFIDICERLSICFNDVDINKQQYYRNKQTHKINWLVGRDHFYDTKV